MKKIIFLIITLSYSLFIYAIIPPKTGIKPTPSFKDFQKMIQSEYSKGYFAKEFRERKQLREGFAKYSTENSMATDTVFALTLMGQYTNLAGSYTQEDFQQLLFDGPNPTGTVTDYYNQVSYGQLHFSGTCFGWYNMPRSLQDYVGDNNGLGTQGGPRFVLDIIQIADATLNFADYIQYYDDSGKPHIGFIAVVHSGGDAAQGANNIWSHRWSFTVANGDQPYITNDIDPVSGQNVIIDGDYAIEPERSGSSNTSGPLISIGVFAHEFGHIFGLPDLYDTDNSSEGLGNWCLMAGGSYGGNGNSPQTPVQMSAWCKYQLGWVTPTNITSAMNSLSVPDVEENPVVYRIWKFGSMGLQYFLVENRQKIGNDTNIYTPGFLIYHVDESQNDNTNENHYLVDLEQADGLRNLNLGQGRGDAGDPFPGSSNNTNFDYDTNPNSKDYAQENTFVSVRNIHRDSTNMIADFDIGSEPYLQLEKIDLVESDFQNGRVEAGETCNLSFTLQNLSPINADSATVTFSIDPDGLDITNNEISGIVNGNSIQAIVIDSAFTVSPAFEPKTVRLSYQITCKGNVINDSSNVTIGIPSILLISKSNVDSLKDFYTSALTELNNYYEESVNKKPEYLIQRDAILIFSGNKNRDVFAQDEIDSISSYINNGGKIMFTGQSLAEALENDSPDFLHNEIGISWTGNFLLPQYAYGINGDLFGDQFNSLKLKGEDGADNQITPDVLNLVDSSLNISHTYKSDGTKPAGVWIAKPNGSKIIFWGFGFEGINNDESSITRTEVLNSILNWFDSFVDVPYGNKNIPLRYNLSQNFPNPFNPETRISYQVPVSGKVTLKVYDILGREVATLVNDEKSAGNYNVDFNAKSLSSGIYFYRLETGSFVETKKMILLR